MSRQISPHDMRPYLPHHSQRILQLVSFYRPTVNHYLRSLYVCFLSAISLCGVTAAAQESNSAYDFLNVTSSAKAYGLGGANISTMEPAST